MKAHYFLPMAFVLIFNGTRAQSLTELVKNGNAKLASSNYLGAESDFSKAIKVNLKVVDAYLEKLNKYNAMNEYQRTTSDMPDGFLYKHELAVPYYGHGLALAGQGKQNDALFDFEKAINIDPKYADAFCERGLIFINQGDKNKGCIDLLNSKSAGSEKAKNLYDKNVCAEVSNSFLVSGTQKLDAKDYSGALADFNYAMQLNSQSVDAHIKAGECLIALKKYDKAITTLNEALKLSPDDLNLLYNRALAYNNLEKYKEAFDDLSVIIKKSPNNYDAFMQRAFACEGMLNNNSAIYDYTEAIRIKPKDGMAYYKRGLANQDGKNKNVCKDFKMAASLGIEEAKPLAEGCNK